MVQANINGTAVHERHSPDYQVCVCVCECVQHSKDTSAQWYASRSFSHPLALFPTILFSSLHPSVYTGPGFSQSYLLNPPPSESSDLTKPSLIDALRQPCTSLYHPCFPCPARVQFLHSLHVPPVLFQTAIMCLGVAQRGAECWLFSIPPAICLTFGWWWLAERQNGVISNVLHDEAGRPTGPTHTVYAWQICQPTWKFWCCVARRDILQEAVQSVWHHITAF